MEHKEKTILSRRTFIFILLGSAIGFGNMGLFPTTLYQNGGLAYIVAYIIAMLVVGIPIIYLEASAGFFYKGGPIKAFKSIHERYEIIGWIIGIVGVIFACYYTVIVAQSLIYTVNSFFLGWGSNPLAYSTNLLGLSGAFKIIIPLVIALIVTWVIIWLINSRPIKKGIARAFEIIVPAFFILLAIFTIIALTCKGSFLGISALLSPDWGLLLGANIWVSVFSQAFFTLGLSYGAVMLMGSYLDKGDHILGDVSLVVLGNSVFEIVSAIGVFSILGIFLAQGANIAQLTQYQTYTTMVSLPLIFNSLGLMGRVLAPIFYVAIFLTGLTSSVLMIEVLSQGIINKFNWSRRKSVSLIVIISLVLGFIFVTNTTYPLIWVVDYLITYFWLIGLGIVECALLAWAFNFSKINDLVLTNKAHNRLLKVMVKYVTPVILLIILIQTIYIASLSCPTDYGIIMVTITLIILIPSMFLSTRSWKKGKLDS